SHEARGIPLRRQGLYYRDLSQGVSILDTVERAREQCRLFPRLGKYAAEILIPPDARVEQSSWEGHYTVWADADDLLGWVVRVVPLL
ncbi:MAG: hypothetical protein AAB114_05695, partial [Chloroflexota bacterium]